MKRKRAGDGDADGRPAAPMTAWPPHRGLLAHMEQPHEQGFLPPGALSGLTTRLRVAWEGGLEIDMGTQVEDTDRRVMAPPTVTLERPAAAPGEAAAGGGGSLTLLLVDPDAPHRRSPTDRCKVYWALPGVTPPATGAPPASATAAPAAPPAASLPYRPPQPEFGNHRFVFLLLAPPRGAPPGAAPPLPPTRAGLDLPALVDAGWAVQGVNFLCMHPPDFGGWRRSGGKAKR